MKMSKTKILRQIQRLLSDEQGQSTTEYILILSVVVMVALKFKTSFQSSMGNMMTKLDGNLQKSLADDSP